MATIREALRLDRAGLTPAFEFLVKTKNQAGRLVNKFVDVAGVDDFFRPQQLFELVKTNPAGLISAVDQAKAELVTKAVGVAVQFIKTGFRK